MDRLACVELPALPLQLLSARLDGRGPIETGIPLGTASREAPRLATLASPIAVVAEDKPRAPIVWLNARARAAGVATGMRYTAALALCPELRAGVVAPSELAEFVRGAVERLRKLSPGIEPCDEEPGVLWLDASGLGRIHPSLTTWAQAILDELAAAGARARIAVGFRRFASYAAVKAARGVTVFATPDEETRAMRRVPLERIGLPADACAALAQLAIRTVGDFVALPHDGILRRFGAAAHRLHQLAAEKRAAPLQPLLAVEPLARTVELDEPVEHREEILFLVKRELDPLLVRLASRGQALLELSVTMSVERHEQIEARVRAAEPTLDGKQILDLLRLRLESIALAAGVIRLEVAVAGVAATVEQLRLFANKPRRDPRAANRAIARVRAALGERAVVRARLRDGHLPEAQFSWEPLETIAAPSLRAPIEPVLVRRFEPKPIALPERPGREPDGWLLTGLRDGPVVALDGPYRLSGGWWNREIARDYYFAGLRSGAIHWIFYDRERRRWFSQGRIT